MNHKHLWPLTHNEFEFSNLSLLDSALHESPSLLTSALHESITQNSSLLHQKKFAVGSKNPLEITAL